MTPDALAQLHARAMVHGTPWSAKSFASVLDAPTTFLVTQGASSWPKYRRGGLGGQAAPPPSAMPEAAQPSGFALGRVVADEAELLTLAVDPTAQGRGIGRGLLARFESTSQAAGARTAFLEVAADNTGAIRLYQSAGWQTAGQRPAYYQAANGPSSTALIMRKDLA